jgi:hypothetical protein
VRARVRGAQRGGRRVRECEERAEERARAERAQCAGRVRRAQDGVQDCMLYQPPAAPWSARVRTVDGAHEHARVERARAQRRVRRAEDLLALVRAHALLALAALRARRGLVGPRRGVRDARDARERGLGEAREDLRVVRGRAAVEHGVRGGQQGEGRCPDGAGLA